jgi:hypothetical protein
MKGGKLVHRAVTADQAAILQVVIDNHRKAKKLLQAWEQETEKLFDAKSPRMPQNKSVAGKLRPNAPGDLRKVTHAHCHASSFALV